MSEVTIVDGAVVELIDPTDRPEPDEVVCSNCGMNDLATVERRHAWQRATFVRHEDGTFEATDWGDDVGDDDSTTVGIACATCSTEWLYAEHERDTDPEVDAEALTTRSEWEAAHPPKKWLVTQERLPGPPVVPESAYETRVVEYAARSERDAIELSSESGMIDGRYPWRGRTAVEA